MNENSNQPPEINQEILDSLLKDLMQGQTCGPQSQQIVIQPSPQAIQARDGDTIDAGERTGFVVLDGERLRGGCLSTDGTYISDNGKFQYTLQEQSLQVQAVCTGHAITITNFSQEQQGLGIKLCPEMGKEVSIVINSAASAQDFVAAFKRIARNVARHILKPEDKPRFYGKITLVSTSYLWTESLGTFYDEEEFTGAANQISTKNTETRMLFYALLTAMRHFTKNNRLKKEIYLITDGLPSDTKQQEAVLSLTQTINRNITRDDAGCTDYCVRIHTFALAQGLGYLKELAQTTGGTFHETTDVLEFKRQLLTLSNDGNPVHPGEMNNEIHYSKANKLWDPDNPNGPREEKA